MLLGVQLSVYWGAACASAPLVGISRPLMTKWCWQGPPPAPVGVGTGQAHMLTWGNPSLLTGLAVEQSDKKKPHLMFTVFQKFVKTGRRCSAMPSRRGAVRDSRWEATFLWFSNWSRLSRHCA